MNAQNHQAQYMYELGAIRRMPLLHRQLMSCFMGRRNEG